MLQLYGTCLQLLSAQHSTKKGIELNLLALLMSALCSVPTKIAASGADGGGGSLVFVRLWILLSCLPPLGRGGAMRQWVYMIAVNCQS